jgi:hypothetical protein
VTVDGCILNAERHCQLVHRRDDVVVAEGADVDRGTLA